MIADCVKNKPLPVAAFFMFDCGLVNQAPKAAAAEGVTRQKKVAANRLQRRDVR